MSFDQNRIDTFDKGLITVFKDDSIPEGSASRSVNFITRGDRFEIAGGTSVLGDDTGVDEVTGYYIGIDSQGTEHHFKKVGTVLYHLDTSTDTWTSIQTGLPTSDLYGDTYRSPAGSFLVLSSPDASGIYRINLANPEDVVNLYNEARNFVGIPKVKNARLWMWNTGSSGFEQSSRGIIRLSYIDNNFPYTQVSSESLGSSSGTLANTLVVAQSLAIQDSVETLVDNGAGVLTGDNGGTGTINYTTGAYSVTWGGGSASGSITADYAYEDPTNEGIFDFRYTSPTRLAGDGSFFFEGDTNTEILGLVALEGDIYPLHDKAIWKIELPADDTNATNKVYRSDTGVVTSRAYTESGDGIYYVDVNGTRPALRLLKFDSVGTRLIPTNVSFQIDLDAYDLDDAVVAQWGEFILLGCKTKGTSYNDIILILNRNLELFDTYSAPVRWLQTTPTAVYGGSSLNGDVFKLFDGNTFDEATIEAEWESNDSIDKTLELKRSRFFMYEGDLARAQTLEVYVSYDYGPFNLVDTITGSDPEILATERVVYGAGGTYGSGLYGAGVEVKAGYFMKQIKLQSPKYLRKRIQFKTTGAGFASIRAYTTKDVHKLRARIPAKFR